MSQYRDFESKLATKHLESMKNDEVMRKIIQDFAKHLQKQHGEHERERVSQQIFRKYRDTYIKAQKNDLPDLKKKYEEARKALQKKRENLTVAAYEKEREALTLKEYEERKTLMKQLFVDGIAKATENQWLPKTEIPDDNCTEKKFQEFYKQLNNKLGKSSHADTSLSILEQALGNFYSEADLRQYFRVKQIKDSTPLNYAQAVKLFN